MFLTVQAVTWHALGCRHYCYEYECGYEWEYECEWECMESKRKEALCPSDYNTSSGEINGWCMVAIVVRIVTFPWWSVRKPTLSDMFFLKRTKAQSEKPDENESINLTAKWHIRLLLYVCCHSCDLSQSLLIIGNTTVLSHQNDKEVIRISFHYRYKSPTIV